MESDLVTYSAVSCLPARSALVLAPHPDDEAFGCGGAIAAHVAAGVPVNVLVLTDGGVFGDANVRQHESEAAARVLGCAAPRFWCLPDRGLRYDEQLVLRLLECAAELQVDLVYAPSPWEVHPDHRQTMMLAQELVLRMGGATRLAFYEVGSPLHPNVLIDITPVLAVKQAAMACFASQLARQDYARHTLGLNQYRTYTLGPEVLAAEAFRVLSAAELDQPFASFWGGVASAMVLKGPVSVAMPVVSVLIRSMDRAFLSEALDSVALQTYAAIEVVVVAVVPGHRPVPARCGPFPVRLVQTDRPLPRSQAANKALDCARGQYLMFLDDDDWLMPSHVERLARVLAQQPCCLAVYGGVSVVDVQGQPNGQVFDIPFDAVRQVAVNLTPIHAVLFGAQAVALGCRFDESLDLYEDWDFWLQIARLTPMVHVPGVSAVYRIHDSSGVNEQASTASDASGRIYGKWQTALADGCIGQLMERVRLYHDLAPQWALAQQAMAAKDAELQQLHEKSTAELHQLQVRSKAELQQSHNQFQAKQDQFQAELGLLRQRLAGRERELDAIMTSRSWRMTSPVRSATTLLRKLPIIGSGLQSLWRAVRRLRRTGLGLPVSGGTAGSQPRLAGPVDYSDWVEKYDTLTDADKQVLRGRVAVMAHHPLISILMPVYNPNLDVLAKALESVLAQVYAEWELCIADDASPNPKVRSLLESFAAKDARIKLVFRQQNGHIVAASNSALDLATGDYVALMDHDDVLPAHALYWVAEAIGNNPDAALIYSDEDKIDERGRRYDPYFKSDWNLELFLSQNMISHLGVYRRALLEKLGGFRAGYEGSQDYDLALRCVLECQANQIVHVPRVLYHWRASAGSTALAGSEKPYAQKAGLRALQDFLNRSGLGGAAEALPNGFYRVRPPEPTGRPLVTVIVPTRNGFDLVRQCMDSLLGKTLYDQYEVLLVDNRSEDPRALQYFEQLAQNPKIRVIKDDGPFNFSRINNEAVKQAKGDFVCLMNNDIETLSEGWLDEMLALAMRPGVGAVGARLWYPNRTLQHGGVIMGMLGVAGHAHLGLSGHDNGYFGRAQLTQSMSAVTAACLLVSKASYLQVGGMNEEHLAVAFNDVDFCLKLLDAGYRNVWTPFAEFIHHESATRGLENTPEKQARFKKECDYMLTTWRKYIHSDPAYNINLGLNGDGYALAWPPRR